MSTHVKYVWSEVFYWLAYAESDNFTSRPIAWIRTNDHINAEGYQYLDVVLRNPDSGREQDIPAITHGLKTLDEVKQYVEALCRVS